ncbi:MAG: YkgJ family cysteine cluster protein [Magnetococcales bacterium]|nr:YkgJ family cysteine cluster protein [Magnetococcales bacterium]
MSDQNQESDKEKVMQLDEELRNIPREIRDIIDPVRLRGKDTFCFSCYPGISCFNTCCSNIEIVLTPYDILRLRKRLDLSAEEFLYEYATPSQLQKGQLPVALMQMDAKTGQCPFVTDEGCSVYEDRPVTCRYYPVGLALLRKQDESEQDAFHFLIKEDFCKGHQEEKKWTVDEWRADQGSDGYDERNQGWMEVILKRRSAGDAVSTSLQVSEFFYMATTNPESFRHFVFDSSFLKRYQVNKEIEEQIRNDDEALTEFAFSWLKSALFGDEFIPVRPEEIKAARKRAEEKRASASKNVADKMDAAAKSKQETAENDSTEGEG